MGEKALYYLNGIGIISPQQTFDSDVFLTDIAQYDRNVLQSIHPDFKTYINPIQMRRLSRMLRIGLSAAMICLRDSKVMMPDGIITATGYGFLDETAKFLREVLEQGEKQLTPTYFMQGTSNALAGLVALTIKCMGYNNTYASKGNGFENALTDAMMQLNDNSAANFLLGSYDEAAEVQYNASTRSSHFKTEFINNLHLFDTHTKGSIQGEGSAFFMVSGRPSESTWCTLGNMQMIYKPEEQELRNALKNFLTESQIAPEEIDVVISGASGDIDHDRVIASLINSCLKGILQTRFKHLCGEYTTATAFALWLGAAMLRKQQIPTVTRIDKRTQPAQLKNILIINQYMGKNFSFILLNA